MNVQPEMTAADVQAESAAVAAVMKSPMTETGTKAETATMEATAKAVTVPTEVTPRESIPKTEPVAPPVADSPDTTAVSEAAAIGRPVRRPRAMIGPCGIRRA